MDSDAFRAAKRKRSGSGSQENDAKKKKLDDEYSQEMECGICLELMYSAVTVMPCLHSV